MPLWVHDFIGNRGRAGKDKAIKPYQPSNGTEGDYFEAEFCCRCQREAKFWRTQAAEDACDIHCRAIWSTPGDPDYPAEWIEDDDGSNPRCTAFILEGARPIRVCKGQMLIDGSTEPENKTVFGVRL